MVVDFMLPKGGVMLVTDRLTRKYISGFDVAEGFLLTGLRTVFLTDARYYSAAKKKAEAAGISAELYTGSESLNKALSDLKAESIYIDFTETTVSEYENYKKFGKEIYDCSDILAHRRSIKDEIEVSFIEEACRIASSAYHDAIKSVRAGMTEKELAAKIERLMRKYGAERPSFETIVAFGENAAVPHHETGGTRLKNNSVILVDMGAKYKGYCSDLTRTAFFGKPDEEFLAAYDAVLCANVSAEEKIRSGMKANEADAIARDILKSRGLGEYFTHSLGHGVGLEIHEFPALSVKRSDELKDGMVFTIEPGVYVDGKYGIRIEDTVILKNGKIKRLFNDSKALLTII